VGGLNIKLERVRAGLRQYKVAEVVGISRVMLSYYENDRRPMPPGMEQRILDAIKELKPQEPRERYYPTARGQTFGGLVDAHRVEEMAQDTLLPKKVGIEPEE